MALAVFIGAIFMAIAAWLAHKDRDLSRNGARVPGVVVGIEWRATGAKEKVGFPVVEFRTLDGHVVRAKTRLGTGRPVAAPGERVPVLYDPARPHENAVIDTPSGRANWIPIALVAMGVVTIGMGFLDTSGD